MFRGRKKREGRGDIVEASADPTPSANEQLVDEEDHHESPVSDPEPDHVERNQTEVETGDCNDSEATELIDVNGSDSEGLCKASTETVSSTSEEEGEKEEETNEEEKEEKEQEHKKAQDEQEKKENVDEEEKEKEENFEEEQEKEEQEQEEQEKEETVENEKEEEDVSDVSEESESMSTEKQMGQIISDIVENVTCDTLEERDAVTGKLER